MKQNAAERSSRQGGLVRRSLPLLATLVAAVACAERVETQLVDWTCDGEKVTVPHTWNAIDGADGHGGEFQDFDNSVAGRGFARCCKTYRTVLADPVPGKR